MRDINATYTKKKNLLRQQKKIYILTLSVKIRNANNVRDFERSSHAVSMIPADSTLIKQCFILSGVYRDFGAKVMEIKVAEINASLN